MDRAKAAEILQQLADGLDVVTGEPLPQDSQFNQPDAIRALFTAIRALEGTAKKDVPGKTGSKWTDEEDKQLVEAFDTGTSIKDLSASHQRTTGGIRSRLIKLGKIDPAPSSEVTLTQSVNPKPKDDIPF